MNASPSTDPPKRTAPLALWRIAEAFMHTLCNVFGNPEDLAAQATLSKRMYALTLSWLAAAEAVMRRLLLIEAAAFAGVAPPPTRRHASNMPPVRTPRPRKLRTFTADKPEEWRVSFRSMDRRRLAGQHRCMPARTPAVHRRLHSPWPLAQRYEALLRAYNDPIPYARRLARRLRAEPYRFEDVLQAPADARHKVGEDFFACLTRSALAAFSAAFLPPAEREAVPADSS